MRTRCSTFWGLLAVLLGLLPTLAAGQAPLDPAGRWEGVIVFEPVKGEVDVVLELVAQPEGGWGGSLTVPIASLEPNPLLSFELEARQVRFEYRDDDGRRRFEAELSDDGRQMRGQYLFNRTTAPFELRRKPPGAAPVAAPPLEPLDPQAAGLGAAFDGDRGKVRLLLVVSPSCSSCKAGVRALARYVLEHVESPELRAYVVWMPLLPGDSAARAERETVHLADPRVRHFWASNTQLAARLRTPLGVAAPLAWDVYLLYDRAARWGEPPPAPVAFWHLQEVAGFARERRLDPAELAREIDRLLAR